MMVRPWVVTNAIVHRLVGIPGTLGAELPDSPAIAMLGIEKGNEAIERVAVGALWVGL
jgi:hypothetical protein